MLRKYKQLLAEVEQEHKDSENLHRDSKVLLVDGMNLFIRVFSAIPTLNEDGDHIGGVAGFLQSLAATIRMVNPTRVVVVFDGKGGSSRRRKLYPNYKEKRAIKSRLNRVAGFEDLADEQKAMKRQLLQTYYYLQNLPITTISIDNIEADDAIGYLANYFKEKVVILSNDRDFLQLVSDNVSVYVPTKKKLYTPTNLKEEYGIYHENFIIYKSLMGDNSDNIKGIRGMGDKTIIKNFPELTENKKMDLDNFVEMCKLYEGSSKTMIALKENVDQFVVNYQLMQLMEVDIPSSTKSTIRNLVDGEIPPMVKIELDKLCYQDKLQGVIRDWDGWLQKSFGSLNGYRENYATR